MIDSRVWLDDPTVTSIEQPAKAGARRMFVHPTHGVQEYVLVKNTSGAGIAANIVVMWAQLSNINVILPVSANEIALNLAGIVQVAIPNNSYGWALRRGQGTATYASAAASGGLPGRVISTAGLVDDTGETAVGTQFFFKLASAHAGTGAKSVLVFLP